MNDFGSQQQAQGQAYAAMLASQGRGVAPMMQQQPMSSPLSDTAGALAKGLGAYAMAQNKTNSNNSADPLGAMIKQNNNWNSPALAPAMPVIPQTYGPQANFNAA